MATEAGVKLPEAMWQVMAPQIRNDLSAGPSSTQREAMLLHGVWTSLRLRDGSVRTGLLIAWDGRVVAEDIGERSVRPEGFVPLAFRTEDIESWGHYEPARQPSWKHPFKKIKVWKVRVWADGRLG